MSFPRYERYKDSGREWLGMVPAHWHVTPLKYVASLKGRLGWQGLRAEEYTEEGPFLVTSEHFTNEAIDWSRCYHVSPERYELAPEIQLRAHDLLMMKDGAAMGKLAYVESVPGPACLNSHLLLFRPRDGRFANRFLFYLLGGPIFETYMIQERTGTTFFGISQESLGAFSVALPPIGEQRLIMEFLAYEITKIDKLIAEQRRLVELLKEKRQAVISHAVTKGLNPNAPMKDSGVEWLGTVPAHWELMPLKRDMAFLTSGSRGWADHYSEDGALFIRIGNLTRDGIGLDLSDIQRVSVPEGTEGERTRVQPGDVLFSITAYLGSVAVVPSELEPAYVSQHIALVRLKQRRLLPTWTAYVTLSLVGKTYLEMQGYGGTKIQLSLDDVANLPMTVPEISEQAEIIRFLDQQNARFDALAAEAESAIALLQERRMAIISAAVTGKIDVRGLVEFRPEEVASE